MTYDLMPKDKSTVAAEDLGLEFVSSFDIVNEAVLLKHPPQYPYDPVKDGYWVPKKDISRKPSMMIVAHTPPF